MEFKKKKKWNVASALQHESTPGRHQEDLVDLYWCSNKSAGPMSQIILEQASIQFGWVLPLVGYHQPGPLPCLTVGKD